MQQYGLFSLFLQGHLSSIADRLATNVRSGNQADEATRIPEAVHETVRHRVTIIHARRRRDAVNNLAACICDMTGEKPVLGKSWSGVKGITGFMPALTNESG